MRQGAYETPVDPGLGMCYFGPKRFTWYSFRNLPVQSTSEIPYIASMTLMILRYFSAALFAFLTLHSSITHAQSAERQLAESFFARFASGLKKEGYCSKSKGCTWGYLSGHDEIDHDALRARGLAPENISIDYMAPYTRWITTKSSSASVEIVAAAETSFIASKAPEEHVAARYQIPIVRNAKLKTLKILPPIDEKGTYAWSRIEILTKREFVSSGLEAKFAAVYSDQRPLQGDRTDSSNRSENRQICEAQKQSCLASCGKPSYWNGSRWVDNQSWWGCNSRCNAIICN